MPRRTDADMTPRPPATEDLARPWQESFGERSAHVVVQERKEKDVIISLRFSDPRKVATGAKDPRTWQSTGLRARPELGLPFDEAIREQARNLAKQKSAELLLGIHCAPTGVPVPGVAPTPMTIVEGINKAVALDGTGRFSPPLNGSGLPDADRYTREVIRRHRLFEEMWTQARSRDASLSPLWTSVTAVAMDLVLRIMAEHHRRDGSFGWSVVKKMIGDVYATARWLRERGDIPHDVCHPRERWQQLAEAQWYRLVAGGEQKKAPATSVAPDRHSEAEAQAIYAVLDDPRGLFADIVGRGMRLSMLADRRRSNLVLECTPRRPHGGVQVEETASNQYVRLFDAEQRAMVDEVLTVGYLRLYEERFLRGEITDYYLLPAGRLVAANDAGTDGEPVLVPDPRAGHLRVDEPNAITIDPRMRFGFDVGGPLRLGQVAQTWRSALDIASQRFGEDDDVHGFIAVPGRGRKESPGVVLTSAKMSAVRRALTTYLRPLEELYRQKLIPDYPLLPQGRLRNGGVVLDQDRELKPVSRDALLGWFRELETAAGVMTIKGRGWYGIRRLITDQAPAETSNEVELNLLSGTSTRMRMSVYQDRQARAALIGAAKAGDRIRGKRRHGIITPAPSPLALDPALVSILARFSPDQVRAALGALEEAEE